MATDETPPVDAGALHYILGELRRIRRWAVLTHADPWAFRQAMITVMAIDDAAALERGITPQALVEFDTAAIGKATEFVESIPREWRTDGR